MTASTKTVQAGRHQVTATVFGSGEPAVVIEPSFGGLAAEWHPVAESLAGDTTVVTYDRAPYGESSPARDHRTPADIATDLHAALAGLGVSGPVVLVGHSVGGMYVRQYAAQYPGDVAGMVLIESSHEGQKPLLNEVLTLKVKLEGLLFYPRMIFSTRKFRGGGDRRSVFREWFSFNKLTAADKPLAPGVLGDKPLIVLTRADGGPYGGRQWRLWHGFHVEQAQLSANSRHVFSVTADHMLHQSDPELMVTAIREVVRSARTGTPVRDIAVPAGG